MTQTALAEAPANHFRTLQTPRDARDRMIVALDVPTLGEAERLVATLGDTASFYKIGMELVFAGGLALVPQLRRAGKRVFLDMKLLDIDNTVAGAVGNIVNLDVNLTTIHAYPGAMRAAADARGNADLALLAVTVLTSMNDADLAAAGYGSDAAGLVAKRAADADAVGMDGIVCSVAEAARVRAIVGPDRLIVTPGIRPAGTAVADQKRVATPRDAIRAGADYCVVGRPVTRAASPRAAAEAIVADIAAALEEGGN
jgi:orotidine-5'-phosphate decarboxylase